MHSFDQVSEDDLKLIKEGSVIAGYFYLTGDVAINKYDEDYAHHFLSRGKEYFGDNFFLELYL